MRDTEPDLVVAGTSGGNVVPVVRAMNALGMNQPLYVGTGSATLDALSPLKNDLPAGGLFTNGFWVDVAGEVPPTVAYGDRVRRFAEEYSARFGAPGATAGGAFDSATQIIDAMRAGSTSGPAIAAHLEGTDYTGVLGPYDLSAERHQGASLPPIMVRYRADGSFHLAFSADGSSG